MCSFCILCYLCLYNVLFLYLAIWLLTLYINERELNSIELKIIQYIFVFLLILQRLKYTVGRM
jgi:hypothetical protein